MLSVEHGRTIARTQATPVLGVGTEVGVEAVLRPMPRLLVEGAYEYARLTHEGTALFDGYVLRLRAEYGFTRAVRLRLVGQYDRFDHFVGIDPLLSYQPSPFTIVYLGSAHTFSRFDGDSREGFAQSARFTERERHVFFKVQYLFNVG
jgi:hypothetical protein